MQMPPNGYGPPPQNYGAPGYGAPGYGPNYGPAPGYGPPVVVYAQAPIMPKCSRTAYVLVGLFLGGLGIHNFMAGRVASGVIQLLITLLIGWTLFPLPFIWLWVIIECIAVTHDGNGVRMS